MTFHPRMAVTLFLLISFGAHADDYIEWVGANSGVNWSSGQVTAEGAGVAPADKPPSTAKLLACRAAVVDAQRNILESIQGVRVNSATVVTDMMLDSDVIKTSVSGLVKGATIVKRAPQDDGSCLVQMIAPIGGKFAKDIYTEVLGADVNTIASPTDPNREWIHRIVNSSLNVLVPQSFAEQQMPWQEAIDNLSQRIEALEELISTHPGIIEVKDTGPTGLVLDARGSNFIPSMSPRIRKIQSGVLYPNSKHQTNARDRGQLVSLFTRDLATARRHPIVGDRPVVIKALRTFGDTRTEIVLGKDASERLQALVSKGFLDDAGVIIVL
ncbi:MAG: hypothetical protein ABGY96_14925 [bacterium]|nr:hypothetical protein [Gammaproteobacteria bacterium]HIL96451.1 hypothetical protein [Pseudomonadales bacterium]